MLSRVPNDILRRIAGLICSILVGGGLGAQGWTELQGRSRIGAVELAQAVRDAGCDASALIVASHPDDRYVLPAALLRFEHGVRTTILLATRGGGGQNSLGPETGDALERIRTLESEAGATVLGAELRYLDRPDGGYCRTAEETFGEWGRAGTLRELTRQIRLLQPDFVVTTHHAEENHGHDLALVELLHEAVRAAGDASVELDGLPPCAVHSLWLGAQAQAPAHQVVIDAERLDPVRGRTYRQLAYDVLARIHLSSGPAQPMAQVLEGELRLVPEPPSPWPPRVPDLFAPGIWPLQPALAAELAQALGAGLTARLQDREALADHALALIGRLRALSISGTGQARDRLERRLEALQRVVLCARSIQVEATSEPHVVAVPGEDLPIMLQIWNGGGVPIDRVAVDAGGDGEVAIDTGAENGTGLQVPANGRLRAPLSFAVPLASRGVRDAIEARYRGDRFVPPVRLRVRLWLQGNELVVPVVLPINVDLPVAMKVLPPALLLPEDRAEVRFSVELLRNSRFAVEDVIAVTAPAGYVVDRPQQRVDLREVRSDAFDFVVQAPGARKGGVDVIRVSVGNHRINIPVHKIDVRMPQQVSVGVVLGHDVTLPGLLGVGGLGLRWSALSDTDLAVRDLTEFSCIVVDFRALRDRPRARRGFRRLLEFCDQPGKRLIVFYHKDTEYAPPGEGFRGAPFEPFVIGRNRVTRADAPVTVLLPGHCLLNTPNRIDASDWDGWEQERCLYLPSVRADAYESLLAMNDPGFPEERNALLYARTKGGGEFVYCALALYRQLKKLHPGAVRLLANLLTPTEPGGR